MKSMMPMAIILSVTIFFYGFALDFEACRGKDEVDDGASLPRRSYELSSETYAGRMKMETETLAAPIPDVLPFHEVLKVPVIDVEPKPYQTPPPPPPLPLQDLFSVDRLHITKRLRMKSVLCLRGKKNRFLVRSPDHSLVYTVNEENRWWVGYFCYGLRPLELKVTNTQGEEVMRIVRPYACTSRIFPCQLQRLQVFAPPGVLIGTVEQQWTAVKPLYQVKNKEGEIVFWIFGPKVTLSCFNDVQFRITRADGRHVGGTCKRWQGLIHALFFAPVTDRFGVAFDIDLTIEEKGLLLASTMLLDYMYYDS